MIYAEYAFYTGTYGGKDIPQADYTKFAARAKAYIDKMTQGQVKSLDPVPENVKMAACAVAEAYRVNETGELTSQTVGSWSKHYAKIAKSDDQRLLEALQLYLGDLVPKVRWV